MVNIENKMWKIRRLEGFFIRRLRRSMSIDVDRRVESEFLTQMDKKLTIQDVSVCATTCQ